MTTHSNNSRSPKPRTRQVSSRFMPNSTTPPEPGLASPTKSPSPVSRFAESRRSHPSLVKRISGTLADHIGNQRLMENKHLDHQNKTSNKTRSSVFSSLTKQRSCREFKFNSFENNNNSFEENDRPVISKSKRFSFPGKSSRNSDCNSIDSESDYSGSNSLPNTTSLRKQGIDDSPSWINKRFITRNAIRRANSLTGYMSSMSQWALSPGRSGSPPMSFESREKISSFSNLRPQNKSVKKILNIGFDLFRTKKSSSTCLSSDSEAFHCLRLLHNRLLQWRFVNDRARAVDDSVSCIAECNLICALDGLAKLHRSVVQKKMQLEREKLEMKLNFVLHSQMKLLETWGSMERQHIAAITVLKQCLDSVVSKVPLLEGAKVDVQLTSIAQHHASDLTASIKSALYAFSPLAEKTAELVSELAKVVAQEKLLLQEFNDLFRTICVLELKERSLKSSLIQLKC